MNDCVGEIKYLLQLSAQPLHLLVRLLPAPLDASPSRAQNKQTDTPVKKKEKKKTPQTAPLPHDDDNEKKNKNNPPDNTFQIKRIRIEKHQQRA
eukprot:808196-Rhodomonas_salina.1